MKNPKVMSKRRRDRRREVRAAMQDEIALSARKKLKETTICFNHILASLEKATEF
jgi:hypothetical protein